MTPIYIKDLSLSFPHKTCFESFDCTITHGSRIAIIGRNGSGKSSLLRCLKEGHLAIGSGEIKLPSDVIIGFVPQLIESFNTLSGAQRFNALLTQELSKNPDILLLDEPTNHLDYQNKRSLMRMLSHYTGTLIIVSHDEALLRSCVDTFWHIDNGTIHIFNGYYDDYKKEVQSKIDNISQTLSQLNKEKNQLHQSLMQEQMRAAKSRKKGEKSIKQKKWAPIIGHDQASKGQKAAGKKNTQIESKRENLSQQMSELRQPEILIPKFSLNRNNTAQYNIITINQGKLAYTDHMVLENLCLNIFSGEKVAIVGKNGSGKSTLIQGILTKAGLCENKLEMLKTEGEWLISGQAKIGYLDQHYHNLKPNERVFDTIQNLVPEWSYTEVRRHLNDFLFRKNEEIEAKTAHLSGGEKARLSLAQIAALSPDLLILDELTNNIDLETKEYIVQVLQNYTGALLVISHDEFFLREIAIESLYLIDENTLISTQLDSFFK